MVSRIWCNSLLDKYLGYLEQTVCRKQFTKKLDDSSKYLINQYQSQGSNIGDHNFINQTFVLGTAAKGLDQEGPLVPPKPTIYISHEAIEGQYAAQILRAISKALSISGFDVLLDEKRQQRGGDGRRQLYDHLQRCHGAVILFSEGVFTSEWVKYETTLLTSRKYLEPEFIIVPILLPLLTQQDLDANYIPSMIIKDIYQLTQEPMLPALSDIVVERFAPLRASCTNSPFQRLESLIIPPLKRLDREILLVAARELEVSTENLLSDVNCYRVLARELLRADLQGLGKAMNILAPHLKREEALGIVKILASSWVDECAAAIIPEVVKRPLAQRSICVDGIRPFTGEKYIRRACNGSEDWTVLQVNNRPGEDQLGALIREIRAQAERLYPDLTEEDIETLLKDPEEGIGYPHIVLVPEYLNVEVLIELRKKYGGLTFFLLPGEKHPDIQEMKLKDIEFLLPPLGLKQETQAWIQYNQVCTIVNQRCKN